MPASISGMMHAEAQNGGMQRHGSAGLTQEPSVKVWYVLL